MNCLVFSRDRAIQLDAFLRSATRLAPYRHVEVLYMFTTAEHCESYARLRDEFSGVCWTPDFVDGFEATVRSFLAQCERVVFHTDDDVFFAPCHPWEIAGAWSGRLGMNTTYCHPLDCEQQIPRTFPWMWREADGDFGYPLCLNATVYWSADLLPLLAGWHFANPTELEAGLAYRAELFRPEYMTAPLHSCCVSLPHNRVSSSSGCRAGSNPDWQPDKLCEMFLDGWRIDLDNMDFADIVGAHQEVPLKFRRGEETC